MLHSTPSVYLDPKLRQNFYAEISSERNMEMSPANYPKTFALLTPKYSLWEEHTLSPIIYNACEIPGGTIPSCCVVFVGFHWISMNQNPELLAEETKGEDTQDARKREMQKVTNLEKKRACFSRSEVKLS